MSTSKSQRATTKRSVPAKTASPSPREPASRAPRGELPSLPTGLASLTLRALGGPNGNGAARPLASFGRQELHRLQQLAEFLDSARRGTAMNLKALAETRRALMTAGPGHASRLPTLGQDLATGRLVLRLLGTEDPQKVKELVEGVRALHERLAAGKPLTDTQAAFLNSILKPFLYRLAHANDRRRAESDARRHVLRV